MQLDGSLGECNVKWSTVSLFWRQYAVTDSIVCEMFKLVCELAILMEILQLQYINQVIR